jgi:hypothetical protein
MLRLQQGVLIVAMLLLSWLLMQAVHELGHAIGAWISGGHVEHVVLHPLTISRTDVQPNPHPLVVVWAGPIFGAFFPLAAWAVFWVARLQFTKPLRFFAGFCLIANGAYIGFGSFAHIGDCGEMLRHGSPIWLLWLFGAVTIPLGLWLWNGLGRQFRIYTENRALIHRDVAAIGIVLLTLVALECILSGR